MYVKGEDETEGRMARKVRIRLKGVEAGRGEDKTEGSRGRERRG